MSAASDLATEETTLDMTPMIDVTFQLLIFFLCNIKFKLLEGKLPTFLPKDVGVNATPIDKLLEKIDVRITRSQDRSVKDLENIDVYRDWKAAGGWNESQIAISLNGSRLSGLQELELKLKAMREAVPLPPGFGTDDSIVDTLKLNVEAMKGVLYADVVQVVDVAIKAKFTSITFRGIENDA